MIYMAYSETPTNKEITMKKNLRTAKNFVGRHRVAIAVTLTAALALKLQMKTAAGYNEFLKEHGLFDEYFNMFEDVL